MPRLMFGYFYTGSRRPEQRDGLGEEADGRCMDRDDGGGSKRNNEEMGKRRSRGELKNED